jgi:hypothetical protein
METEAAIASPERGLELGTARLQQAAPDGEVVVGPAAQRLLRGAVIVNPLDGAPAGPGWQVLEIVARAPAIPRALDAPILGRQGELTRLRSAFRRWSAPAPCATHGAG